MKIYFEGKIWKTSRKG